MWTIGGQRTAGGLSNDDIATAVFLAP